MKIRHDKTFITSSNLFTCASEPPKLKLKKLKFGRPTLYLSLSFWIMSLGRSKIKVCFISRQECCYWLLEKGVSVLIKMLVAVYEIGNKNNLDVTKKLRKWHLLISYNVQKCGNCPHCLCLCYVFLQRLIRLSMPSE